MCSSTMWTVTFCENILCVSDGLSSLSVNKLKDTDESQRWTWVAVSYFRICTLLSKNDSMLNEAQKSWRIYLKSFIASFLSAIVRLEKP